MKRSEMIEILKGRIESVSRNRVDHSPEALLALAKAFEVLNMLQKEDDDEKK